MAGWHLLSFSMQAQAQRNWCWAAIAVSVAAFFDQRTPRTQCNVADEELRRTDCCGAGSAGPCNVYGSAVLADETKFGTRRFAAFARAEDIDCLVTTPACPPDVKDWLEGAGASLVLSAPLETG